MLTKLYKPRAYIWYFTVWCHCSFGMQASLRRFRFSSRSLEICALFSAVDTSVTSWGGIIVTPGMPAYSKEDHRKEEMVEEGQTEEQKGGEEGEVVENSEEKMAT